MSLLSQIFDLLLTPAFAASVLRITTPILFAALGGLMARRCGIMNLALEGSMLTASLFAVIASAFAKKAVLGGVSAAQADPALVSKATTVGIIAGFIVGTLAGIAICMFLAYMAVGLRADAYLAGLAINTMATGGTVFILYMAAGEKGISSSLDSCSMPFINIPGLKDIPVLGEIFSGQNLMTYFAWICVAVVYFIIFKTATGLRIRAVGENPNAAESVGVNVKKVQYQAMALSGLFCGFGGVSLSMSYVQFFSRGMTAGKGFIGMSAMNLGNASPVGTAIAAFLFGFFDAMGNVMQSLAIPVQFVQAIPYVATLVGLVVFAIASDNKVKKLKAKQGK
ncbi:MAG: ABC transporter permease [Oscillospiraceae bacterium]|nr:ABC transporter permease [Oscillospiraceae bacterium]